MSKPKNTQKFGTAPVFFTAISTILGAVMFLRFGYAVGNVGLLGTIAIIILGHAVTIPTAMAIAEIATNQKVEGGGEYYIISRSFGLVIGSSIGLALFFSQAISVAFYIIAFSEAFSSLIEHLLATYTFLPTIEWLLSFKQFISVPALLLLTIIILYKGADLGVKALYVVVATLMIALAAFFIGTTDYSQNHQLDPFQKVGDKSTEIVQQSPSSDSIAISNAVEKYRTIIKEASPKAPDQPQAPVSFIIVFAIIFPAFTGMTAGVGLSGDLRNPSRSIPLGTLGGTICGMVVYFFIAYKLAISASPEDLANTDRLIMADIAWQGWLLVPIGLAAATISSALGSILVAPRTLQAIAKDNILPSRAINWWLAKGRGKKKEPYNATLVTVVIAFVFVMMGGLDFVAGIISMFFMVTYGSLCLISFLRHFAADPSYRPTFRSRWYISLFGAIACIGLMFFMNAGYAILAILLMIIFYLLVEHYNPDKNNMAVIFQGVIFQLSRRMQVFLQKAKKEQTGSWRPSVVCISENSFNRYSAFDLLRWISYKYGFGTYIHKITGYLSKSTHQEAQICKNRLIAMSESIGSNVYIDSLISPSYTSAIAQVIQLPGISGSKNNLLMFEYSKHEPTPLNNIIDNFNLITSVDFDVIILGSSERGFGFKKSIHIWITDKDYENATLMILLGYIILGHPDWQAGEIKIFAIFPEEKMEAEKEQLFALIETGQLPISSQNINFINRKADIDPHKIVNEKSQNADMCILGFRRAAVNKKKSSIFEGYDEIGNVVFVNSSKRKLIK